MGLDFARMVHCRGVVGYANEIDPDTWVEKPEDDGLFLLDLRTGESRLILSIADVIRANPCEETQEGPAWFNHVYLNPDGDRLLFLCRVRTPEKWHTSMWSVDPDGSDPECQIDYGHWTSHFAWYDARRVVVSTSVLGPRRFAEFTDRLHDHRPFGGGVLPSDGHNSFSPDGRWMVCDAYPKGPERLAELMLYHMERREKVLLGRFYSDAKYTGDIRCDLHPRWSPDGKTISFDSVHGGSRQIYLADVSGIVA